MDRKLNRARLAPFALRAGLFGLAGLGLSGCTVMNDPYGYGGVSVGVGYYDDGYYDPYYDSYYGWYEDYYYPGTGYYVYDRRGYRHRWNDHHRHYWMERRSAVREIHENWAGYTRDGDGHYRDHRRAVSRDGRDHRGEGRHGRRTERDHRGDTHERRDGGFAGSAVRQAAEAAREQRAETQADTPRRRGERSQTSTRGRTDRQAPVATRPAVPASRPATPTATPPTAQRQAPVAVRRAAQAPAPQPETRQASPARTERTERAAQKASPRRAKEARTETKKD